MTRDEPTAPYFHVEYPRSVPARRPVGHEPAAPRFSLRWQHPVHTLVSDYFGVQGPTVDSAEAAAFVERMRGHLTGPGAPAASEVMHCTDETGRASTIVVAYWSAAADHNLWAATTTWRQWWDDPARLDDGVGYWYEHWPCPYDRHETIYSDPHYRIGFGRTPNSVMAPITTNGYFGAARDRVPLSAIEDLEPATPTTPAPCRPPDRTLGRRLAVAVPHNLTVLRSGQFWHDSEPEQVLDYEQNLLPKLDRGMDHLVEHPDTGCLYLRRMTNLSATGSPRGETSTYVVFRSLAALESWAATHETHLAIYRHAIAMKHRFGDRRDVVTWHELFVLPGGTLCEYLNCAEGTGLLPFGSHLEPAR
jgi:aldoxime dehydratase